MITFFPFLSSIFQQYLKIFKKNVKFFPIFMVIHYHQVRYIDDEAIIGSLQCLIFTQWPFCQTFPFEHSQPGLHGFLQTLDFR